MKRVSRNFERGFSQWVILLIMIIGIGVGVWVAQVRTNLVPQAAKEQEFNLPTSMSLKLGTNLAPEKDVPFRVQILLRNEIDTVRLISSQIKYDPAHLELIKVENPPADASNSANLATPSSEVKKQFVSHWLETLFDNKEGKASLTALFDESNFKTNPKEDSQFLFTTLLFRPILSGETEIKIDDTSVMLRAADNANILLRKENLKILVSDASQSAQPN